MSPRDSLPLRPRHPASLNEEELLRECRKGRSRSSGPGGQHRNKVETKVTLTHTPTGVEACAGERRSVRENMPVALRRLRLALASEIRLSVPIGDARSELWLRRTPRGRIVCALDHWDFPSMLAEALDMIEACGLDPRKAALRLGVTPTQLIRLVREHPPAFESWNARRLEAGEHALH